MSISNLAIRRPIGTVLVATGLFLFGIFFFRVLPVADLPNFSVPVIYVIANQPGSTPHQMASAVTTPLERRLGNISKLTDMYSFTTENSAFILLVFEMGTDVNSSARDVEASLRAARSDMPKTLLDDPQYFKASPADSPIMITALTSDLREQSNLRNLSETTLKPIFGGIKGIGWIEIVGPDKPAIRVEVNPDLLFHYGLDLEDVRSALASANANTPKGHIDYAGRQFSLLTNDQATQPNQYENLVIGYRKGRPIHLYSVARIYRKAQNERKMAWMNGHQSSIAIIRAQPGANIIDVTRALHQKAHLLESSLPADTHFSIVSDRSVPIQATLHETEHTLLLSIIFVITVILAFFGRWKTSFIPIISIPVVTMTTIGVMGLCHFSLNLLSLMGLTIASSFIVDDAIVVTENISKRMEEGYPRKKAVLMGTDEISFTILSMSISLIAVFMPLLLIGGITRIVFFEFAMTITIAVITSYCLSITLIPMLCRRYLTPYHKPDHLRAGFATIQLMKVSQWTNKSLEQIRLHYKRTLAWALQHPVWVLSTLPISIILTIVMIEHMPKAILPAQDISLLQGNIEFDQSSSFTKTAALTHQLINKIKKDKDVDNAIADTGEDAANESSLFITLKNKPPRQLSAESVAQKLHLMTTSYPGMTASISNAGDLNGSDDMQHMGTYSFAFKSDRGEDMPIWIPKIVEKLRENPIFTSVNSPLIGHGHAFAVHLHRDLLARYHLTPQLAANSIYDLYGQRVASRISTPRCIYYVTLQAQRHFRQNPSTLQNIWISTAGGSPSGAVMSNTIRVKKPQDASSEDPRSNDESSVSFKNSIANKLADGQSTSNGSAVSTSKETMIPIPDVTRPQATRTNLQENHIGGFISGNIAFDLQEHHSLDEAEHVIRKTLKELHVPQSLQGDFTGNAQTRKKDIKNAEIALIVAIGVMYVVLGILYEDFIQPITILSTLPSAAVGSVGTLYLAGISFSFISIIAIFTLIGIVKKNAILMIDLALRKQRQLKISSYDAIIQAAQERFRPIMMTTICAVFSALPMVSAQGYGSEMIVPLGLALLGGLLLSQLFTLFTTPILYILFDRLRRFVRRRFSLLFTRGVA